METYIIIALIIALFVFTPALVVFFFAIGESILSCGMIVCLYFGARALARRV